MQKINFKYMSARNFLCFGPDGIEIDFTKIGNIISIRGDNLDVFNSEDKVASNGVGKSSIPEILVYTLYGKTIKNYKKISHNDVINNQTKKNLVTEVIWDKYRVERKRKPNSLRIWESKDGDWSDKNETTLGTMKDTQALIEEKIGLNYEGFMNLVVFTDNNASSFLELDAPTKRLVVENLLGLDQYREYLDKAKLARSEAKDRVKYLSVCYDELSKSKFSCEARIESLQVEQSKWSKKQKDDLEQLNLNLANKNKSLESSNVGKLMVEYENAQVKIAEITNEIYENESKQKKVESILLEVQSKIKQATDSYNDCESINRDLKYKIKEIESDIEKHKKEIVKLNGKKTGVECHECFGEVNPKNFIKVIERCESNIQNLNNRLKKFTSDKESSDATLESYKKNIESLKSHKKMADEKMKSVYDKIASYRKDISELSKINKPIAGAEERIIQESIKNIENQIVAKKEEMQQPSPFVDIIDKAQRELAEKTQEINVKKKELDEAEGNLPYYEFWVKAFGDNGIRKFVIDGIIPSLNSRIEYWMQVLIDGKIKLTFDNQLEETIQKNPSDGDPFVYWSQSGGERRRLNLATMLSWAHVAMLNSGKNPSAVWLDEVTSNIDQIGVSSVYDMIQELSNDKQVFVTTHDQDLLEMLGGNEVLKIYKKNGIAKLAQ